MVDLSKLIDSLCMAICILEMQGCREAAEILKRDVERARQSICYPETVAFSHVESNAFEEWWDMQCFAEPPEAKRYAKLAWIESRSRRD